MPNLPEDILDRIRQIERKLQRTATVATTSAASSPWQSLPLTAGFTAESTAPQYRIQGPVVAVRGDVTVAGGLTDGAVIATLPAGARPAAPQIIPVATPNTTASYVEVDVEGNVAYHGPNAAWSSVAFIVALG